MAANKSARSATDVDRRLGLALRDFRRAKGISQTAVAEQLGVSFQQIQKYECGANRMSFARVVEIALIMGVDPHQFVDIAQDASSNAMKTLPAKANPLQSIRSPKLRRQLEELILMLSEQDLVETSSSNDNDHKSGTD